MIELSMETIDKLFLEETKKPKPHQSNILVELYKIAFKDWEKIQKMHRWPSVSKATTDYLFKKFIEFDKIHHPDVFAGGLWMNNGFSWNNDLGDWLIDNSTCEVVYRED